MKLSWSHRRAAACCGQFDAAVDLLPAGRSAAAVDLLPAARSSGALLLLLLGVAACGDAPTAPGPQPLAQLPDDLAAVTFTAAGRPTHPFVMLELIQPEGFSGYVLVNAAGRPVWLFRTNGGVGGFARRANGNLVLSDPVRGLLEVTTTGTVVRSLAQGPDGGHSFHHDLLVTPWNTVLAISDDWQPVGDTVVNGAAIWEWSPESGSAVRRWSAFAVFDPARDRGPRYFHSDWLHPNSLALGARGNILLSLHFLDQVISLSPDYTRVEWRLGGVNATIPVDDPFSGQHTVRETAPDRVLMFDNGFAFFDRPWSRAVEYEFTSTGARRVWEWRAPVDNWARIVSSAFRLDNGHTFIGFGTKDLPTGATGPIEAYEIDRTGAVRWHLRVDGPVRFMYRATPLRRF